MQTFTADHTPADIVKAFPKASDLFKENKIDFCCGGDKPLEESFEQNAIDGDTILSVLNDAYHTWKEDGNKAKDWDTVPLSELIDHIVDHHHAFLKEELAPLGEFVTKIFRVHGADQPHLKELYRLYHEFRMEMEEHSFKEEQEVFPLIKEYEQNPSEALLEKIRIANGGLEEEHDAAGDLLKQIRVVTNSYEPPLHACGSYRITYARLKDLEAETFQHVHLENNVLFKRL